MNEKQDTVSATHPDYDTSQKGRTYWNDVMVGTLKLREKHSTYLPQFPAELDASYKSRYETATFFNMTEKTRNVMTGLVFQAPIELEGDVPNEIKTLWENLDNQGTHGDVFWRDVFESAFEGFAGVLIDAPTTKARSLEEEQQLQLRPYAILYHSDSIINWRYRINEVSKAKELELIVLKEITNEPKGRFTSKPVTRYRVFQLITNLVTWELWEETEKKDAQGQPEIVQIDGGTLDGLTQIPFAVVGCLGDNPPLLDIAIKNVEHFQTYSDYKSLIHKTCVPLLVAKDLVKPTSGEKLIISGDKLTEVGAEGELAYTELEGKSLETVRTSLLDNREEIALMGLSLLADKTAKVDITATEALLNSIGETAELRVMARNCQDAIELSLGHIAEYQGKPRPKGGSVIMGTAWAKAEQEKELENERTDIQFKTDIQQQKTEMVQ